MRARYYEPGTGRLVSEDRKRETRDWYIYCAGDPVNDIDESGCGIKNVDEYWALMSFLSGLSSCVDSGQVEASWGVCIAAFQQSDADIASGIINEARGLGKVVMAGLCAAFGEIYSTMSCLISYAAMTIGQGIFIGSQAVMLAIGYEAREAWYVADIDND